MLVYHLFNFFLANRLLEEYKIFKCLNDKIRDYSRRMLQSFLLQAQAPKLDPLHSPSFDANAQ